MKTTLKMNLYEKLFVPCCGIVALFGGAVFYRIWLIHKVPLDLQAEIRRYLWTLFFLLFTLCLHQISNLIFSWYLVEVAQKTETHLDDELVPLGRTTAKILLWMLCIALILPLYNLNISGLIATLGVSSLAIALAAKDTISNIIAGFMIMIDRPFRIGDKIMLPTKETVTVIDIGVRRSLFLSEEQAIVIVPNLDLVKSRIINYSYGEEYMKNNKIFDEE